MSILISKLGMVYRTRAESASASAVGEQGETEGIIHHLLDRGEKLVYYGSYRGKIPDGLIVVQPSSRQLDDMSTGKAQRDAFACDVEKLDEHAPYYGFIQVAGYSPTMCLIDNPNGATVQACTVKYTAPQMMACEHYQIPRCVLNCDPRNYPKEQEMSLVSDWWRPKALLDQIDFERVTTIGRRKYLRRSVYAGVERWAKLYRFAAEKTIPCTVVAHAHMKDGLGSSGPTGATCMEAWKQILAPRYDVESLFERGMAIYGKGWQHFPGGLPNDMWKGVIRPHLVEEVLARSKCGPIVTAMPGFYTGKIMVYLAQDCVPLLWGDGTDPHTYDRHGRFLDLDSPWRLRKPGDLKMWVDLLKVDDYSRREMLAHFKRKTLPDWTLLDDLCDDLRAGKELDQDKYGGYTRL